MDHSRSRRNFLQTTTAALAAVPIAQHLEASALAKPEKPTMALPIVDTHQHLWDLKQFRLPWLEGEGARELARNYVMTGYVEAIKGLNVVKSIYMEVDVHPSQQAAEAEFVVGICKSGKTPMVGAVISGRPASEGFEAYITLLAKHREIKGLRQVLHGPDTPAGFCLEPAFVKGIKRLGALGLSFDLCMRSPELPDAAKLVDLCPDTSFILDHCGNESVRNKDHSTWKRDIDALAKHKNVVGKISGIVASAKGKPWTADDLAPIVNHIFDAFGPDRVVFGGDWPVCTLAATYRQWVEALRQIVADRPEEHQRKLFQDNALRVYVERR